jgi:hypothetical protein
MHRRARRLRWRRLGYRLWPRGDRFGFGLWFWFRLRLRLRFGFGFRFRFGFWLGFRFGWYLNQLDRYRFRFGDNRLRKTSARQPSHQRRVQSQ